MYLTKILISKQDICKHRLFDNFKWKQVLCRAIPPEVNEEGRSRFFLFRVFDKKDQTEVLVQSERSPMAQPIGTWSTKQIPSAFYGWSRYQFDCVACPTEKKVQYTADGKRKRQGKRIALSKQEQAPWMSNKLLCIGAQVISMTSTPKGYTSIPHKGSSVTSTVAHFSGILMVTDRNAFIQGVSEGIGSERAFGYGLVLLKPIA